MHRLTRQRRLFTEEVVETTVGERQSLLTASDYRQYIYYSGLDNFIAEMDRRFDEDNTAIMKAIKGCTPISQTFLEWKDIQHFCIFYSIDDSIRSELEVAKNVLKSIELKRSAFALLHALPADIFPHLT